MGEPDFGSVLRLSPWWLSSSLWLLLGAGIAAGLVAAVGVMPVYESGFAVVHTGVADSAVDGVCSITPPSSSAPLVNAAPAHAAYVAVLPGNSRPQLVRGMPVLLRVTGYPDAVLSATLESFGDRLIAPSEAQSVLESLGADPHAVQGPLVPICGRLEADRFRSGGDEYALHDGMLAVVRVKVREERLFERLVPRSR